MAGTTLAGGAQRQEILTAALQQLSTGLTQRDGLRQKPINRAAIKALVALDPQSEQALAGCNIAGLGRNALARLTPVIVLALQQADRFLRESAAGLASQVRPLRATLAVLAAAVGGHFQHGRI